MATIRRKNVKKGLSFSIMVAGGSGLGKSTFINTLCGQNLVPQNSNAQLEETKAITPYTTEFEEDGVKMTLTLIDTPGFGDSLNDENKYRKSWFGIKHGYSIDPGSIETLLHYIETQFDEVLLEETRIKRNPKFQDNRVHCLLYFIAPTGHALRELDIVFLKRLGARVNIIPVIAKSDSLSSQEISMFKKRVMEDIAHYGIPVFQFPSDAEEEDQEVIAENAELKGLMPFTVIGAEGTYTLNNKNVRGREYPWGICEVDNTQHCDFSRLRYVLLTSHLQDLKDITHDELYEKYRTQKLISEEKQLSQDHSREMSSNTELREEVAKQVMIKEEMLKKEEEKLREMELKVQREIEAKRRELLLKEQSLKEMEQRLSHQDAAGH